MDNKLIASPKRLANQIGVVAAVSAVTTLIAEILILFFGSSASHRAVGFILGSVVMVASFVGFAAASLADRRYRLTLIAITTSVVFVHFVTAFSNFGN